MKNLIITMTTLIFISSCNIDTENPDKENQENFEVNISSNTFEKSKKNNERFVVIGAYDFRSFLAHKNTSKRVYAKAIFDTETDVLEIRMKSSNASYTRQYRIENLINSDDIYESYKAISIDDGGPNTIILLSNGIIFGPYPAVINSDDWLMYCDWERLKGVYEDLDHYLDDIDDISFEIK